MNDDTPATKEDLDSLATEIRAFTRTVAAAVAERQGGTNSVQLVVPSPDSGERAALRTEKYTYLLGGLLIGTLMWFGMSQLDQGRKIERMQDYLNMLWQRNPQLQPENLKQEKKP